MGGYADCLLDWTRLGESLSIYTVTSPLYFNVVDVILSAVMVIRDSKSRGGWLAWGHNSRSHIDMQCHPVSLFHQIVYIVGVKK